MRIKCNIVRNIAMVGRWSVGQTAARKIGGCGLAKEREHPRGLNSQKVGCYNLEYDCKKNSLQT